MRISDWSSDVCSSDLVLIRQASNTGQLYGSVSVRDIVDALVEDGVEGVTKAMVELERPIKALGLVDVKVKLHPEVAVRSEEHTSELQSLMRISYAVFCLKKKTTLYKIISIN